MADIFSPAGNDHIQNPYAIVIDPTHDYFSDLVGDDKKFKDEKALARGKAEADAHIARLEHEKAELKQDFDRLHNESQSRARLEELIDKIAQANSNNTNNDNSGTTNQNNQGNSRDSSALNPEELKSMVSDLFKQELTNTQKERNMAKSMEVLKQKFGENYVEPLKNFAKTVGLTEDQIRSLAQDSPAALGRLIGLDTQSGTGLTQERSSTNSASFKPNSGERTYSYYEKMRKDNPKEYHKTETQIQRMKDADRLGEKFFDTKD